MLTWVGKLMHVLPLEYQIPPTITNHGSGLEGIIRPMLTPTKVKFKNTVRRIHSSYFTKSICLVLGPTIKHLFLNTIQLDNIPHHELI